MKEELSKNEKEFFKEIIKNFDFGEFLENKSYIKDFIKNNLNEKRIEAILNKDRLFNFDAHYHFRTNWMSRLKLFDYTKDPNIANVIGGRPSLQQWNLNSIFSFNEKIKKININKELWDCFDKTKNKIFPRKMPFSYMFINKIFELTSDIFCFGFGCVYCEDKETKKFGNLITILGYDYNDETDWRTTISIDENGLTFGNIELFNKIKINKIANKISTLFVNIIDFFNHPEVEVRVIEWPYNKKRIGRKKLPIPDKVIINLKGKLYKYIYDELPQQIRHHKSLSCSFWVRGHYIHFWNSKIWKRIYSMDEDKLKEKGYQINDKGIISKWVLPYIKGKGILKNKEYKLSK